MSTNKYCKLSGIHSDKSYYDSWQNVEDEKYNNSWKSCYCCPTSNSIKKQKITYLNCKLHLHKMHGKYLCCDHLAKFTIAFTKMFK